MSVRGKLASALGRNDERPNVELAEVLAARPNAASVTELVELLSTGTVAEQNDAIKVLYELGERKPDATPRMSTPSWRYSKAETTAMSGARCRRSTPSPRRNRKPSPQR